MSDLCMIDAGNNQVEFDQMDQASKSIVQMALKNGIGVCFNSFDYAPELIEKRKVCFHMILSDSFVHRNCDELLDISSLDLKKSRAELLQAFRKKFLFFDQISAILNRCGFSEFDLYIDGFGSAEKGDFEEIETDKKNLLTTLFCCVLRAEENKGNYELWFPPLKVHVILTQ